jgi:hypothetical protein
VDITGGGAKSDWLKQVIPKIKNIDIYYHGFVSDEGYAALLREADICIALQDPQGRYASNKTPSKVYEYLGHYKTVIATDVGDLATLPKEIIRICDPFNEEELSRILSHYITNRVLIADQAMRAGDYAYEYYSYQKVGKVLSDFITEQERVPS